MPIYEYKCEKCGEKFDVQQKFADEPLTVHDKCGGHVERLLSVPALQFKGSGFYITDYAKGSSSPGNGGAKNESKSDSKTESKPAETKSTTTESKPAPTSSEKT